MMKRIWCSIPALVLAVALGACSAAQTPPESSPGETVPPTQTLTGRIVSAADGSILLAGQGGDTEIYTLSLGNITLTLDGADFDPTAPGACQAFPGGSLVGALVTVSYDGTVMECYPLQLGGITAADLTLEGFDDLCGLYLQVLEGLWNVDSGLNSDLTALGVDLSQTRLTDTEQAAVAWAFGQATGILPIRGTYEDLVDQGYIDSEHLIWEDGCLFSIKESTEPVVFNLPSLGPGESPLTYDGVQFDAEKWRSALGAYYFLDCTAVSSDGHWGTYTKGSEAIS